MASSCSSRKKSLTQNRKSQVNKGDDGSKNISNEVLLQNLKDFEIKICSKKCYDCSKSFKENEPHYCPTNLKGFNGNDEHVEDVVEVNELATPINMTHRGSVRLLAKKLDHDEITEIKEVNNANHENIRKKSITPKRKSTEHTKIDDSEKHKTSRKSDTTIQTAKKTMIPTESKSTNLEINDNATNVVATNKEKEPTNNSHKKQTSVQNNLVSHF